jgi:glycosyltransferase involved in cell wall biosynthesis
MTMTDARLASSAHHSKTVDPSVNDASASAGRVFIVDLTSRTPPYDRRLSDALERTGADVEVWIAGSDRPDQIRQISGRRQRGVVDVSTSLPVTSVTAPFVRGIKAVEYVFNVLILAATATSERPNTVHFQWLPLLSVSSVELLVIRYLRWLGINVVYTAHDVVPLDEQSAPQAYRDVYQTVDAIVCHTRRAETRLIEEFQVDPEKISVIPHGPLMDRASFPSRQEARAKLDWPQRAPTVLLFGVLRPYKGVEFLLQAWSQRTQIAETAQLVIAGYATASYKRRLRGEIRRLGIDASVRTDFRFLPEDELRAYIAAADVVAYPYRNITQSGALFAGMNAGRAVVVTDVGGLPEVIDDGRNGFVVDYGDAEALVDRLEQLGNDADLRRRFEQAAQATIDEHYSWDTIARKTLDCYRDLSAG